MNKPHKNSIAYVIYNKDRAAVLSVQRPAGDDTGQNMFGLPAGNVNSDETEVDSVIRSGREKLGVVIKPVKKIGTQTDERAEYFITLSLYEAEIISGNISVPQPYPEVTQYQKINWMKVIDAKKYFSPIAQEGSVCTRIFLESLGYDWSL